MRKDCSGCRQGYRCMVCMARAIFIGQILILALALTCPAYGLEIGGINMPEKLNAGDENAALVLNGAGLRKKFFVKVYAGGLYLLKKSANATAIISADEPMAIRMHFIYDEVPPEKLIETWNEGFVAATGGNTKPIQAEIEKFNSFFTKAARKNDVYEIVYTPEKGVRFYAKDRLMGVIPGMAFKKALFGIWLGEKPADGSLKAGMLGK